MSLRARNEFNSKERGFTLTELFITLAILSLVMGMGVPSMRDFVKNDRLVTQINTLVGQLAYARSEALLRHQSVVICASGTLTSCSTNNWASGWIVFVDSDNNADFSAGEDMLRQVEELSGSNTLASSIGSSVVYDKRGFAPNSIGSFTLCDDRGDAHKKSISISATGRVKRGGGGSC
ncbi:MAG: prepilin-type N-terminal cleavage/methylation domain-containing protein [Gammaproteobacteria bacterium]|nr:prepilin-type N-terminal cleavage/methylation domain-containing protein [Gammaproteobacteria bacterium]